jgi:ribonuclease R
MQDKLGEEYTGIITGVTTFGIFVQLDQLFVEGMVHVTDLGADYFQYDDARHELRGERTGKVPADRPRARAGGACDLESRKIDLRLAGIDAPAEKADAPSKASKTNLRPGLVCRRTSRPKIVPKAASKAAAAPAIKGKGKAVAKPAGKAAGAPQAKRPAHAGASAAGTPAAKAASKSKKKR